MSNEKIAPILRRRSIRKFVPGEVTEEEMQLILEAAMAAPSTRTNDPWRFIVVRKKERLAEIAEKIPNGKLIAGADVGLVVCGELEASNLFDPTYMLLDCTAAIENALLAVSQLDLGACWIGINPRLERMAVVREMFNIPSGIVPIAILAIGHPGEEKPPRTRYNADFIRYEMWANQSEGHE